MFGICLLSVIPLRSEHSDKSEIVSQVLFGEHFEIIDSYNQWSKIKLQYDGYEGWVDSKQYQIISREQFDILSIETPVLNGDLLDYITDESDLMHPICIGASLNFIKHFDINKSRYEFEGTICSGVYPKSELVKTTYMYLNAPYLWGGKTPFGIDCSGFTQMVYKLNGYKLLRDASEQATQGVPLSFIEEAEPGDLAFFDNEEGNIIHVGVILKDNYIIHASGRVRIDRLDHLGIYNPETKKHTHKLRIIKKII